MKSSIHAAFLVAVFAASSLCASELVVDKAVSSVAVDVKASPPHEFTCDLQAYKASIDLDPETGQLNGAEFSFHLTDLETHNDKRNAKMERWMDVDTFNTISWKLESVEMVEGQSVAHGTFTMHGQSQPLDVRFHSKMEGNQVVLTGESDFNYMDYELPKIRLFIFTVKPDLHVHFELKGSLASQN